MRVFVCDRDTRKTHGVIDEKPIGIVRWYRALLMKVQLEHSHLFSLIGTLYFSFCLHVMNLFLWNKGEGILFNKAKDKEAVSNT